MSDNRMRNLLTRLSSRKFLTTLAVEVAALIVLFAPGQEETVMAAARHIAAIAAMVLATLGYVRAEADVDRDAGDRGSY